MVCQVECPTGALQINENVIKINNNCIKCEKCLDRPKGCLVARSVLYLTGGKNVKTKGLGNYKGFGFQKDWLEHFFKLGNDLWNTDTLGGPKYVALKIWLRESEITENNALTPLGFELSKWGANDIKTWAIILNNLAYNSNIIRWYVQNTDLGVAYSINEIFNMLGYYYSSSTKDNAIDSLKKTFRYSPIGAELGVGVCEIKGNAVVSITRTGWANPDPLVILYSLYKFAERSDGYYSFTLNYLCDHTIERAGISPTQIFGIDRKTMKEKLQSLATDYKDFISVSFSKDLDNIDLNKEKTSLDVVGLF
jgi:phosphoadenosine phosphosulfate reductase